MQKGKLIAHSTTSCIKEAVSLLGICTVSSVQLTQGKLIKLINKIN